MVPLLLESQLCSTLHYTKHFYFLSHLRLDYSNSNMKQQEIHAHLFSERKDLFLPGKQERLCGVKI